MSGHHSGFFRVPEDGLRKIAAAFEEPWASRAATLAYITLLRKANLRGSVKFEDRLASMANDMALPYREAQRAIRLLESIHLVEVERRNIEGTKAKLPSIYTVATLLPDATTSCPDAGTLGEDGLRGQSPHLYQEHIQEQTKNGSSPVSAKRPSRLPSSQVQLVDGAHITELKTIYTPISVDRCVAACRSWLLTPKGKGKVFTKKRLQTFLRDAEPIGTPETKPSAEGNDPTELARKIDPAAFAVFVAKEYPLQTKNWITPADAPARVIKSFTEQNE